MKKIPHHFIDHDETLMSNFDHSINHEVEKEIKGEPIYAQYSGWNFCGYVWFEDNQWNCEVWRYNVHRETISCDSLEEIMQEVSDKYGHE